MSAGLLPAKPRLRGRIHQVAFFVSIPAGVLLIVLAHGAAGKTAAIIYAVSLSAVFGASASYHVGSWSKPALRRMKRLDHSMIFMLIAGSYTPVALLVLHGAWSVVILSLIWTMAALGITLKLARIDGLSKLAATLYVSMGWLIVIPFLQLYRGLSTAGLTLLVAGGALYTLGAVVFAKRTPDPNPAVFGYHEVWHAFIVAAAACHWAMILLVLRAAA
ncbi:MAG: hemolysin III family protein [Actinomycetota bacterium]|jgi:hemolysin III